jgi:DNA-binding transcriptional MerR regulator
MPHTPATVAAEFKVSRQTVRNWSSVYGDLLSPSARGELGARVFTEEDVDVLRTVNSLRKTGLSPQEIIYRIESGDLPPVVEHNVTNAPQIPQASQSGDFSAPMVYSAIQQRLDAIERKQRDSIGMFVYGALAGLLAGIILFWLAYALASLAQ